jgi:Hg(II)-responsive transcriptional regulator
MKAAPPNDRAMTVGRTAQLADVGIPTMRFYERAGLLPKPLRTAANYRLYPDGTVIRIRFIRRAQQLGFSLKEIRELLELRVNRKKSCSDVRQLAGEKIADIETRMRSLQRMRRALLRLSDQCDAEAGRSTCPLLDSLEADICS